MWVWTGPRPWSPPPTLVPRPYAPLPWSVCCYTTPYAWMRPAPPTWARMAVIGCAAWSARMPEGEDPAHPGYYGRPRCLPERPSAAGRRGGWRNLSGPLLAHHRRCPRAPQRRRDQQHPSIRIRFDYAQGLARPGRPSPLTTDCCTMALGPDQGRPVPPCRGPRRQGGGPAA